MFHHTYQPEYNAYYPTNGSLIGNTLNHIANGLNLPGRVVQTGGVLVNNGIVDIGNLVTRILHKIDPTHITPWISYTITKLLAKSSGAITGPGKAMTIPGNVVHKGANIIHGTKFKNYPLVQKKYPYNPRQHYNYPEEYYYPQGYY